MFYIYFLDTQIPLTMMSRRELPQSCISNKLSKLTLATFDEEGKTTLAMLADLHDIE